MSTRTFTRDTLPRDFLIKVLGLCCELIHRYELYDDFVFDSLCLAAGVPAENLGDLEELHGYENANDRPDTYCHDWLIDKWGRVSSLEGKMNKYLLYELIDEMLVEGSRNWLGFPDSRDFRQSESGEQ